MRSLKLPDQRWLRAVVLLTSLVFVGVAVYVFAVDFAARLHPDGAVMAILADKLLRAPGLVVSDWYYANGDVWVFGPQLFALIPVAIFGVGLASLLISLVLTFTLQTVGAVMAYRRLCGEPWIAGLAAMTTLMAWSVWHVDFNYVQVAYGFVTVLYLILFATCAALGDVTAPRWWRFAALGALVIAIAVQNPVRALTYGLAPVFIACAWPWRDLAWRKRFAIAGTMIGGWLVAYAVYRWLVLPAVQLSVPSGHVSFAIRGWARIKDNLELLRRGIVVLCGGGESSVRALPGILLLVGALGLVGRELVSSRAFTALRFVCVAALAQFGGVLVLVVVGNLLTDPESTRYLLPGWLVLLGLAAIIAARAFGPSVQTWGRRFATGWLVMVPVAALAAIPDARPPAPVTFLRPDAAELRDVASELEHRGLTAGFSINIAGNLVTLFSHGTAVTCPLTFRNALIPQRWLADTSCFLASRLPERFYVVVDQIELELKSLGQTLPAPIERFTVGDTYAVYVYRTAEASLAWLDLPIPDGIDAVFPMRFAASNLQLTREKVVFQGEELVGTGEAGTVVYGPYIELLKGDYDAVWYGRGLGGPGQVSFSAIASFGRNRLAPTVDIASAKLPTTRAELIRIPFSLSRARQQIEFPVTSSDGGRVSLHELVIERKR